jgi:DNA-binding GntR family transcriptional regulator
MNLPAPSSTTQPVRDRSRHAAPQVFDYLREQIISLAMPPGTLISRQSLQDLFGFSSTPVRDALMRLQEESLVEIFPQHATVVSPIDLRLARQAQFLRRSLEQECVRTIAANPDRSVAVVQLEAMIERKRRILTLDDLEAFNQADQDFHRILFDASGVPDLWVFVRRQSGHIDRIRRLHLPVPGKAAQIIADHAAIVAGIESGIPEQAEAALRNHLSRSLAFTDDLRARWPDYFRD